MRTQAAIGHFGDIKLGETLLKLSPQSLIYKIYRPFLLRNNLRKNSIRGRSRFKKKMNMKIIVLLRFIRYKVK